MCRSMHVLLFLLWLQAEVRVAVLHAGKMLLVPQPRSTPRAYRFLSKRGARIRFQPDTWRS